MSTRVLVAARLSRVNANGDQGRIDRDDSAAKTWAESRQDVEIVAVSEDAGVSGSVSPFDRPALGPWLTDPHKRAEYDEIVASSIDRLGRNARDLQELRNWAEDNGKVIRVLKPELQWPLPTDVTGTTGRIVWEVLGAIAEIERQLTQERYDAARRDLISRGALVGKPPWGFMVVGEKFNKTLAPDPKLVPILRGMIDRAMKGDSYRSIAQWLDSTKIPPKAGGKNWSPSSVRAVLQNPALMGRRYENNRCVLSFQGVMTLPQFKALQAQFESRPKKRGPNDPNTAMLTGVLRCQKCKGPMYRHNSQSKRKDGTRSVYTVYRCKGPDAAPSKCGNAIKLADVDGWVNEWFSEGGTFGSVEVIETITVPGDDHADEIAEIEADIRDLDLDAHDFLERQKVLMSERARLRSLPSEPPQVVESPTGQTVGQLWVTLDTAQKRAYLLATGVQIWCYSSAKLRSNGEGQRMDPTGKHVADEAIHGHLKHGSAPGIVPDNRGEILFLTGEPGRIAGALRNVTHA